MPDLDSVIRASIHRIEDDMAKLLDAHPDWTVDEARLSAIALEIILYGVPMNQPPPRGVRGQSPLTPLTKS